MSVTVTLKVIKSVLVMTSFWSSTSPSGNWILDFCSELFAGAFGVAGPINNSLFLNRDGDFSGAVSRRLFCAVEGSNYHKCAAAIAHKIKTGNAACRGNLIGPLESDETVIGWNRTVNTRFTFARLRCESYLNRRSKRCWPH